MKQVTLVCELAKILTTQRLSKASIIQQKVGLLLQQHEWGEDPDLGAKAKDFYKKTADKLDMGEIASFDKAKLKEDGDGGEEHPANQREH